MFPLTCKIYLELRGINSVSHSLSHDALKILISAFGSLAAGCPKRLIHKLQKLPNNAAKLICRTPKSDHISPALHIIHRLPIEQRTGYKMLFLALKSVNNKSPLYLSDLKLYIPSQLICSSSDSRLLRIQSESLRQCKFFYQASILWNTLSHSLRHSNSTAAFKSALKTHLFPHW